MAGDAKATKPDPAPKSEAPAKKPKEPATKGESAVATETAKPDSPKAEAGEKSAEKPANYSRGEGQKAVTQAYKDNWNAIFGKKKKR